MSYIKPKKCGNSGRRRAPKDHHVAMNNAVLQDHVTLELIMGGLTLQHFLIGFVLRFYHMQKDLKDVKF